MPDVSYGTVPFADQVAFFRRKINLPTNAWTDIWESEHDHAFVVAGANRDDLLADFRAAIDKAISQGTTLEEFRKDFDAIVAKYGWSYTGGRNWRSRVIYETNLRTSYAAGRYAQLQAVKSIRPYWQYVHSDAVEHPRPQHLAWNGMVLSADDPWWNEHYPPNGWGCRCTVHSLGEDDLARLGKDGADEAPATEYKTVTVGSNGPSPRTVDVPDGVDPGFGYAPGQDAFESWLAPQAEAALEDGAAEVTWEPLAEPPGEDLAPLPLADGPDLGEVLHNEGEIADAVRDLIGGDGAAFDVQGLPVAVSAEALAASAADDTATTPYLPLLADLLSNPAEVWYRMERNSASGATRVRATLLKAFQLGKGKSVVVVANEVDGLLESWSTVPADDAQAINAQRVGLLWYGGD